MTTAENSVFAALPGIDTPVGGIGAAFQAMWADSPAAEMRAMQLNLVLHLGANTGPEDAERQFRTTVRLSQRYPCRVVVLCPDPDEAAAASIRAKIYGECSMGKSRNDARCCEFVILNYNVRARQYLENQVSVCLSTDLPLYYWAHRFAVARRLADYHYLLTRSRRIMFDSAVVAAETLDFPWPNLSAVRDLAYTRTLPLRQNLGQLLSRYAPDAICAGLHGVSVRRGPDLAAEAACLLGWVRKGLARSGASLDALHCRVEGGRGAGELDLTLEYGEQGKGFSWRSDLGRDEAVFNGDLGTGRSVLTTGARLMESEAALAEAMFF